MVGRCGRYWHAAVPGLREYENKIEGLASSRSAHLSRGNLKQNFDKVVFALRAYLRIAVQRSSSDKNAGPGVMTSRRRPVDSDSTCLQQGESGWEVVLSVNG